MKTNRLTNKDNSTSSLASVCLEQCRNLAALFAQAKEKLIAEFRDTFEIHEKLLLSAVGEAEALAWATDYPHLVFPALALEKVRVAANWHDRQEQFRRVQPGFAFAA